MCVCVCVCVPLCNRVVRIVFLHHNRLQCCGLKVAEAPSSAPPQLQEVCRPPGGDAGRRRDPAALAAPSPPPSLSAPGLGTPGSMLAHKRVISDPTGTENGLGGKLNNNNQTNKTPASGLKPSASIRDKISQWEGKREPGVATATPAVAAVTPASGTALPAQREPAEAVRKREAKPCEVQRTDSKRLGGREKQQDSGKENAGKLGDFRPKSPESPASRDREGGSERGSERGPRGAKPPEQAQDKKSVLTHIKKLERAMKEVPDRPSLAFPGNYFCPPSKEEQEEAERRGTEPIFGSIDGEVRPVVAAAVRRRRKEGDPENVYSEPGAPSINPLPKPQRTFQHHTPPPGGSVSGKGKRNLPPLPRIPPPPLPTSAPPGVCRRPWADKARDSSNR